MNQYIVIAHDYTDADALNRRLSVRPAHFDNARKLKEQGRFIKGGAILNDEGMMIGSVMMMQFENEQELENWKKSEPYITGKVWEKYDVKPFKVADV